MNFDQQATDSQGAAARRWGHSGWCRTLAVLASCGLLFGGSYGLMHWSRHWGQAASVPAELASSQEGNAAASKNFRGWERPDFALVLTGQLHGYLQPCGCSSPQYGGLARRWELLNALRNKGWPLVPVDLGDVYPQVHGPETASALTPPSQKLLKYETAMEALRAMGYFAVGLGKEDFAGELGKVLPQFALRHQRPRVLATNLVGTEEEGPYHAMNVRPYLVIDEPGLPKIGVVAFIAKSWQNEVRKRDPNLAFAADRIPAALGELARRGTEFNLALFQTEDAPTAAGGNEVDAGIQWCASQKTAPLHVVLHSSRDPEPPSQPRDVAGVRVITVGHKGKYVGVLGVWKKGERFETKYEMVLVGPEYEPRNDNPVTKLMDDYAERVKARELSTHFGLARHKTQVLLPQGAKYIGSEACASCHQHAYDIWEKSKHAHAYDTLVEATKPALRQFDGECLLCHTTGFPYETGFNDPQVRRQPRLQKKLLHVGCESCHGPGSAHANNPDDRDARKLINPWAVHYNQGVAEKRRLLTIDFMCQKCHDTENDVHWNFEKRWADVIHMNPDKR
ncbi:MAG: hypothetical protein NZO58_11650 [Gemmataceae bacterium]|nr:hypothetical protein [Gemmataceae bacterium]